MNPDLVSQLDPLFHPRGVAVIGASNREGNFGRLFIQSLLEMGYQHIYPVNPRGEPVLGIAGYANVMDLPQEIDLAIVATPTESAVDIVQQCAQKGIPGVVLYTSGFGEKGAEGKLQEQEMAHLARKGGTRLIGPNCQGIYCPASRLAPEPGFPKEPGPVGMISSSGFMVAFTARAGARRGVRFSKVISCGNQCDLNAADFLEYLGQDEDTKLIVAYLEEIKEGQRFFRLAREISGTKPIIIWKGGITQRGARAAASHTGALAGSRELWQALCTQAGIVSVKSAEELLDLLVAFYHLPLPKGRGVAIISGPGGPAVGATDACAEAGLHVAELSPQTRRSLGSFLPATGTSVDNPIDMGMGTMFSPQWYGEAINILTQDPSVDMLLIISPGRSDFSQSIVESVKRSGKPAALATTVLLSEEEREHLSSQGIPSYSDWRRAAMALAKLAEYADFVNGKI